MKNWIFKSLIWIIKRIMKEPEILGIENIEAGTPSIFVSNHEGIYAPVALMIYTNLNLIPWVVYQNFERKLCKEYIKNDFVEPALKLKYPLSNLLSSIIAPICMGIMKYLNAIPVYKGNVKILETIKRSVGELEKGNNLLIFPEKPDDKDDDYLKSFQTGFVNVAKALYKHNSSIVNFYPVYVDKKNNRVLISKKISFNPSNAFLKEKTRIINSLYKEIIDMIYEKKFN